MTATRWPREQAILAHYLAHGAVGLNIVVRAYPHGELLIIVDDKMRLGTRASSLRPDAAYPAAARAFVDLMIERGAFSTIAGKFGGTMHRLQPEIYQAAIAQLQTSDPVIAEAKAADDEATYWREAVA